MMTARDVAEIHQAFAEAGISYWIGGGWGVDALLGYQTREHADLDVLIPAAALDAVLDLLAVRGFAPDTDWLPVRIQLRDAAARAIDVHPLVFEPDGSAWLPGLDGERFVDEQTGTAWTVLGRALEGPLAGKQLAPVVNVNHFWFSWAAFRPETRVFQSE